MKPHVGQCMNTAYTNTGIAVRNIRVYICLINVYMSIYTNAILLARFERVAYALSAWLGLLCQSTSGRRKSVRLVHEAIGFTCAASAVHVKYTRASAQAVSLPFEEQGKVYTP
jgi:hypothetical protein